MSVHEEEEDEYWEEEVVYPEVDVYEEIEHAHRHNVRQIILEQLNELPNDERREQFREAIGTVFIRFGGNMADLEEVE